MGSGPEPWPMPEPEFGPEPWPMPETAEPWPMPEPEFGPLPEPEGEDCSDFEPPLPCEDTMEDYCSEITDDNRETKCNKCSFLTICPKSCKICDGDQEESECEDTGKKKRCKKAKKKPSLCNKNKYKEQCMKTCNLCPTPSPSPSTSPSPSPSGAPSPTPAECENSWSDSKCKKNARRSATKSA